MTDHKKDMFILELSNGNQLPGNTFQVSDVIVSNQVPTYSNMISHYELISFAGNSIRIRLYLNIDCNNEEFEKYILKNFAFSCYNYQIGKYLSLNINHFE